MTTKLKTELTVDPAVELSSRFFLDAKDRRYLDDQIRALSSYFVQGHLRGSLRSYFKLDLDSDPLDPGDVFVSAGTAPADEADPNVAVRLVTKATPAALSASGVVLGIAIEACTPGGYLPGALDGLLGPSVTGLTAGAPMPVRVSSAARCEAVASLVDGDFVVGFKDAAGNLTIARSGLGGGGSAGSGLPPPAADGSIFVSTLGSWIEYLAGAEGDRLAMVSGQPTWQPPELAPNGSGTLYTEYATPENTTFVYALPEDSSAEIGFRVYGVTSDGVRIFFDGIYRAYRESGSSTAVGSVGSGATNYDPIGTAVLFAISGANITMQISGADAIAINWRYEWWVKSEPLPIAPEPFSLPPGYDPRSEGTCVLWLDPADSSTYTLSTSVVTAVTNKASNTAFTTVSGTPDYVANGINGHPCFAFSGNEAFETTESAVVNASDQPWDLTVYYVGQLSSVTDAYRTAIGWSQAATVQSRLFFGTTSAGVGQWGILTDTDTDAQADIQENATYTTGTHIHEWVLGAGVVAFNLDNENRSLSSTTPPAGAMTANICTIGAGRQNSVLSNSQWNGRLGDVMVFVGSLSAQARARIRHYLIAKYA